MQKLKSLVLFLQGKKSHILALLGATVAALQFLGYVTDDVAMALFGLLGFGAVSAMRAGIARSLPKG